MAEIHYIWWGNPSNDDLRAKATDTPNIMCGLVHGTHEVHYWRNAGPFTGVLDDRITVHEVDTPSSLLTGTALASGNRIRLDNVMDCLTRYRAYAAAKDLMSFLIMHKRGGYFFDTTTQIGTGYAAHTKRLLKNYSEPRVPYYKGGNGKTMLPDNDSADYTMIYAVGVPSGYPTRDAVRVDVPNFDVWAFYSPPEHEVFAGMIESYLNRCQNIGLDRYPATVLMAGTARTIDIIMNQANKDSRNSIIAGLSTTSCVQGLYRAIRRAGLSIQSYGWEVKRFDKSPIPDADRSQVFSGMQNAAVSIPEIGIQKAFGGSWR